MAIWRKVPNKVEENETKNKCETEEKSMVMYDPITGCKFRANTVTVNDILEKEKAEMANNDIHTINLEEEETREEKHVGLVSPWAEYAAKIKALFGKDPEIRIEYDGDIPEVRLFIESAIKAEALMKLLPDSVSFGPVNLRVTIIPANDNIEATWNLFRKAFDGNPVFRFATEVTSVTTNPITYVAFKPEVVQYYNDNLGDAFGNCNTLYQDLAIELFNDIPGVFYCTDKIDKETNE